MDLSLLKLKNKLIEYKLNVNDYELLLFNYDSIDTSSNSLLKLNQILQSIGRVLGPLVGIHHIIYTIHNKNNSLNLIVVVKKLFKSSNILQYIKSDFNFFGVDYNVSVLESVDLYIDYLYSVLSNIDIHVGIYNSSIYGGEDLGFPFQQINYNETPLVNFVSTSILKDELEKEDDAIFFPFRSSVNIYKGDTTPSLDIYKKPYNIYILDYILNTYDENTLDEYFFLDLIKLHMKISNLCYHKGNIYKFEDLRYKKCYTLEQFIEYLSNDLDILRYVGTQHIKVNFSQVFDKYYDIIFSLIRKSPRRFLINLSVSLSRLRIIYEPGDLRSVHNVYNHTYYIHNKYFIYGYSIGSQYYQTKLEEECMYIYNGFNIIVHNMIYGSMSGFFKSYISYDPYIKRTDIYSDINELTFLFDIFIDIKNCASLFGSLLLGDHILCSENYKLFKNIKLGQQLIEWFKDYGLGEVPELGITEENNHQIYCNLIYYFLIDKEAIIALETHCEFVPAY